MLDEVERSGARRLQTARAWPRAAQHKKLVQHGRIFIPHLTITFFIKLYCVFHSSSAVEQLAVNQLVVGSIPTCGAVSPMKIFARVIVVLIVVSFIVTGFVALF